MRTALIMAGGQGQRMTRSGIVAPKPLVPLAGVPLLERNLHQLVRAGVERIVVSVGAAHHQVRRFVADRLTPLGRVLGVAIEELVETAPLGNIGAARALADQTDALLVVYADNLTSLALEQIHHDHRAHHADLTLAVHTEPFRLPFGEVRVDPHDRGRIVDYVEKPTHEFAVCSAIMVLGTRAMRALPADCPTGISELAKTLVGAGGRVRAWHHSAPWIDVNDAAAVARAERLLAAHRDTFETWWPGPVEHWRLVVEADTLPVDVEAALPALRHTWRDLDAPPADGAAHTERDPQDALPLGSYDTVDLARGVVVRAHVVLIVGRFDGDRRSVTRTAEPDATPVLRRALSSLAWAGTDAAVTAPRWAEPAHP